MHRCGGENSLHYIWIDWRNLALLQRVCNKVYDKFKALCVWNKTQGGMSGFYIQKHELCVVYKKGRGRNTNNINTITGGRFRCNVWNYMGPSDLMWGATEHIERFHPTMKPTSMIKEAILDVTNEGDIVVDLFGGSGTTMVSSAMINRKCYMCEKEMKYCNGIIRRMVSHYPKLGVYRNGILETDRWR